jgi:glycosyltransferase involved in cell wall biosynthesis
MLVRCSAIRETFMDEAADPVDLIIPARNEAAVLPALLAALPWAMLRQVVVADNGSVDGTAAAARAGGAVVVNAPQRGYGAACLAALDWIAAQKAPPEVVAFIDADLSDDPAELGKVIGPVQRGEAALVIGSRQARAERGALELHQRFGTWLACGLMRLSTGWQFTDLGPMRAIAWSALQQLAMADRTWGWTVEMQFKAAQQGLATQEVTVAYRPRQAGRSKISGSVVGSVRAGWKILTTVGRLWWQGPRAKRSQDHFIRT